MRRFGAARVPRATYRLQFHREFGFAAARRLVPYLDALGVSDLYASPLLAARRGSTHGYDVTDPTRLNPELGSAAQFASLTRALRRRGMGLLLDSVPNHMAASVENPWWRDVLECGRGSPYAAFFDIDWRPGRPELRDRILLPILGDRYARVLERGELRPGLDAEGLHVTYFETRLPIAVETWGSVLLAVGQALSRAGRRHHAAARALGRLAREVMRMDGTAARGRDRDGARRRARQRIKRVLWRLYTTRPGVRRALDATLRTDRALLAPLLARQHYRLADWRRAAEAINYRRFFNIAELVSLRIERRRVFEARHALLLRLVRDGHVTGIRLDHIDGLYDPAAYLKHLRHRLARPLYVVVEKILLGTEDLPADWPIAGTTGYDFLGLVNGLLLDAGGWRRLGGVYRRQAGRRRSFEATAQRRKRWMIARHFEGETRALTARLAGLAARDPRARRLPARTLGRALVDVTAGLDVYRTYSRGGRMPASDRLALLRALRSARRPRDAAHAAALQFLRRVLLSAGRAGREGTGGRERVEFVMRWQQYTGPVMAKGVEDTAFYRYNRLLSVNEVGGSPERPCVSPGHFHRRLAARAAAWPHAQNTTATHDTKRGEDARARIDALSECPNEWEAHLRRWMGWNRRLKRMIHGRAVPDRNEEMLLYQTLLGAWPLRRGGAAGFRRRIEEYVVKAAREAKARSSWLAPDARHEKALVDFASAVMRPGSGNRFLADFLQFQGWIARCGALKGLAQLLVKIAAPGVPDLYQGNELWDLRLVDPDNRRPVDFEKRERMLRRMMAEDDRDRARLVRQITSRWADGRLKLFLTWKGLAVRRRHTELFLRGDYLPLRLTGSWKRHLCAFARRHGDAWVVVAVPRLVARLAERSGPLALRGAPGGAVLLPRHSPGRWVDLLTGDLLETAAGRAAGRLPLNRLFTRLPVAFLGSLPPTSGGGAGRTL